MGTLFIYAVKSAICLTLLYLPYTLLMRKDTFYSLNRGVLLVVVLLSAVIPLIDNTLFYNPALENLSKAEHAVVEVGLPVLVRQSAETTDAAELHASSSFSWADFIVAVYFLGAIVCLVIKLIQLFRLNRFIRTGCLWTSKEGGANVYCHADKVNPFSWMNSIVISEDDYANNPAVMTHEMAHIRKHHSWDNLAVAFMEVVQWFNPCVWLLDASLKMVHEYEADDAVLRSGITAKDYQILLIKKAISNSAYTPANGFNYNLLKNRFTMMMKKNSNKWSRAKALYLLPMMAVAIGAFATTGLTKKSEQVAASNPVKEVLNMKDVQTVPAASLDQPNDTMVFLVAEQMPAFKGGMAALQKWLAENIHYPAEAQAVGAQTRVIVSFVVYKDGSIGKAEIKNHMKVGTADDAVAVVAKNPEEQAAFDQQDKKLEAAAQALDKEALRVINSMPKWTPGKQRGKNVNVQMTIPITFRLQ